MAKTRVLFVVHGLWRAGAETQLVALVNGLPAEQFEKHIFSYRPGDDLKDDVNTGEVEVFEFRRKRRLDFGVVKDISRIIDEQEIDIVHCTMRNATLFGYMGIRFSKRKPKLIAAIHSTKNTSLKLDIADLFVYRSILKKCTQVWFVSTSQAKSWVRKMPFLRSKAITIHNGIDLDEFEPVRRRADGQALRVSLGIAEDENVLCCVAGFRPEKLHSVMIDAFSRVRGEGYSCRLLLAGSGPLEQALRDQVKTLNLDGSVDFLGLLSDVRAVLAVSDCMLLVSAVETFSMAMLEAMAMGLPVVTTSVGGAAEAIENGVSGHLVKPRDVSELTEKITELLADDVGRQDMGKRAREVVVEQFSATRMIQFSANSLIASLQVN